MQATPKKIAIIEDDQNLRFIYKFKLEHEGFQVTTANNGIEGLDLLEKERPDLILLDLMMPEMGGAEMLTQLREIEWGSSIKVIILTNLSKTEAPQSLRFLHVDRYIVKAHYTPSQVVETVHEVLHEASHKKF